MRRFFTIALFILAAGWISLGSFNGINNHSAYAKDRFADEVIRIGFDRTIFGDIDKKDAEAVINLYIKEWGKQINYQTKAVLYSSIDEIISDLQADKLDMVSVSLPDFAYVSKKVATELAYTNTNKGRKTKRYLLLTHMKSGVADMEGLKGKRLALSTGNTVGNIFIDTLALRHSHTSAERFFSQINRAMKPSKMILDLFFNRIDACLVDDWTLDAMSELNPQINETLSVIAESPPLVTSVTFFRKEFGEQLKKKIRGISSLVDGSVYGRQLLMLFKSDGIEALEASDLNGFYRLADEYEWRLAQWKAKMKKN